MWFLALAWFLVSVPVALVVGRCIAAGEASRPALREAATTGDAPSADVPQLVGH